MRIAYQITEKIHAHWHSHKQMFMHISLYGITALIMRGLSVISAPVVMYLLSPSDFGIVALINSFINTGAVLMGLGIKQYASIAYLHHSPTDRPRFIINLMRVYMLCTLPMYCVLSFFTTTLNAWFFCNALSPSMILLILGVIFLSFFVDIITLVLQQEQRAHLLSKTHLLSASLLTISKLGLLWAGWGPAAILGSQVMSILPLFIIAVPILKTNRALIFGTWQQITPVLVPSLYCLPGLLAPWILTATDRWCLAWWATPTDIGMYAVGDMCAQLFNFLIFYVWQGAYVPYLYQRYRSESIATVEAAHMQTMYGVLCAGTLLVTVGFIIGKPLLYIIFPPAYLPGIPYIWFLLINQLLLLAISFLSCILQFYKKIYILAIVHISTLVLNVAGNWLLIPSFGLAGCIGATLFSTLVTALILYRAHSSLLSTEQ